MINKTVTEQATGRLSKKTRKNSGRENTDKVQISKEGIRDNYGYFIIL